MPSAPLSSPFLCPACAVPFDPERACGACGATVVSAGGIHDFFAHLERPAAAQRVTEFYTRRPFPGYASGDDAHSLLDRCKSSPFLRALDRAIAPDARVLDCGAGTGQLAAFLALSAPRRSVIALDACRASLEACAGFRARAGIDNLRLVRGDLFALPLAEGAFDVVISRGVVHHTPDPARAIAAVARRTAPGGHLVLGFYENVARGVHRARRLLSRVARRPLVALDPVLRRADLDPQKKENWIADQYHHPLERMLPFPRVQAQLEELGFTWVRSVPPSADAELFDPTPRPSSAGLFARRVGWCLAGFSDEDAGLVATIVRRQRA